MEIAVKPVAIVDVETTGLNLYRNDRVIEVAALLLTPGEGVVAEFTTLVNPERDIGPTRIHGIRASDIINAPRFSDIAGHLVEFIRDAAVLVGHNVRFDISFLQAEFARFGVEMPHYKLLDTMACAGGGTLSACCAGYSIKYEGHVHAALHDARATASLLQALLAQDATILAGFLECTPPAWPAVSPPSCKPVPRGSASCMPPPVPGYVQRLAECLSVGSADASTPEGERDYRGLLWRALEDGRIEESEGEALVEVATRWGLPFNRIEAIHLGYLSELAKAAWADHNITDAERREILQMAQLLGFGSLSEQQLQDLLRSCEISLGVDKPAISGEQWCGKAVCFTGDSECCIKGQLVSREVAERLAADRGLKVMSSVTKKLDLLVVADPYTQSGKAKKARQYGIRIVHEPTFWRTLGVQVD